MIRHLDTENARKITSALAALEDLLRKAVSEGDINAVSVRVPVNHRKLGKVRVVVERELT